MRAPVARHLGRTYLTADIWSREANVFSEILDAYSVVGEAVKQYRAFGADWADLDAVMDGLRTRVEEEIVRLPAILANLQTGVIEALAAGDNKKACDCLDEISAAWDRFSESVELSRALEVILEEHSSDWGP